MKGLKKRVFLGKFGRERVKVKKGEDQILQVWFFWHIADTLDSFINITMYCSLSRLFIVLYHLFYSWNKHPLSWHPQVCWRIYSWFSIHRYSRILVFTCILITSSRLDVEQRSNILSPPCLKQLYQITRWDNQKEQNRKQSRIVHASIRLENGLQLWSEGRLAKNWHSLNNFTRSFLLCFVVVIAYGTSNIITGTHKI